VRSRSSPSLLHPFSRERIDSKVQGMCNDLINFSPGNSDSEEEGEVEEYESEQYYISQYANEDSIALSLLSL
jgi:hypothetical protein